MALGHAYAYSAAKKAGVPQVLLDVYEWAAIPDDPALVFRAQPGGTTRAAVPDIKKHLEELNVKNAGRTSIISDADWLAQVQRMPKYTGNAQSGIPGVTTGTEGAHPRDEMSMFCAKKSFFREPRS